MELLDKNGKVLRYYPTKTKTVETTTMASGSFISKEFIENSFDNKNISRAVVSLGIYLAYNSAPERYKKTILKGGIIGFALQEVFSAIKSIGFSEGGNGEISISNKIDKDEIFVVTGNKIFKSKNNSIPRKKNFFESDLSSDFIDVTDIFEDEMIRFKKSEFVPEIIFSSVSENGIRDLIIKFLQEKKIVFASN